MVFQNYALYPHMTVKDNMAFSLMLAKVDKAAIGERVKRAADILGLGDDIAPMSDVTLVIHRADGTEQRLTVKSRIDTAIEVEYVRHGGILPYVLRSLLSS